MFLTKIGSHKKYIGSIAKVKKKVMKKSLGGGLNLPRPNWNRVKHGINELKKKSLDNSFCTFDVSNKVYSFEINYLYVLL